MNTPSRAKESDRLISQLTDIMNADIRPDKAVLMQLEWQAKNCERIDPLGAHVALAMIAVLRFDCAATGIAQIEHVLAPNATDALRAEASRFAQDFVDLARDEVERRRGRTHREG